jgi:hypothetical protein
MQKEMLELIGHNVETIPGIIPSEAGVTSEELVNNVRQVIRGLGFEPGPNMQAAVATGQNINQVDATHKLFILAENLV